MPYISVGVYCFLCMVESSIYLNAEKGCRNTKGAVLNISLVVVSFKFESNFKLS